MPALPTCNFTRGGVCGFILFFQKVLLKEKYKVDGEMYLDGIPKNKGFMYPYDSLCDAEYTAEEVFDLLVYSFAGIGVNVYADRKHQLTLYCPIDIVQVEHVLQSNWGAFEKQVKEGLAMLKSHCLPKVTRAYVIRHRSAS